MHKDPEMTWEGAFPYDALAAAGVTPQSSMDEIMNANLYFMKHEPSRTREVRPAWDQLRRVEGRLLVDFFLYRAEALPGMEAEERERPG